LDPIPLAEVLVSPGESYRLKSNGTKCSRPATTVKSVQAGYGENIQSRVDI
jgi:hypothetical protein